MPEIKSEFKALQSKKMIFNGKDQFGMVPNPASPTID